MPETPDTHSASEAQIFLSDDNLLRIGHLLRLQAIYIFTAKIYVDLYGLSLALRPLDSVGLTLGNSGCASHSACVK